MSTIALQSIAKLLEAKAYEVNPMDRGMTMKELAEALKIPQQTVSSALKSELGAAKYGIFKLTPGRQRYVLWAYSLQVANKANGLPFEADTLAGIDPKVQAAEVNKLVTACVKPEDHDFVIQLKSNLNLFIERFGLSVGEDIKRTHGDMLNKAFELLHDYYKEQAK